MNKTEYIVRQIAKSYKKKYENYVITRIWHLLNSLDIKFVTQQHITRPSGRALTDMYFPQINLHIEVDEGHHFDSGKIQVNQDFVREADIIDATGHQIKRVDVFNTSIESIHAQVDTIVEFIKSEFVTKHPPLWDIDAEYNPQTYIDRGSISVSDNVAFRTIADACNCFGHLYQGYQKAFAKHAVEEKMLWFPKLYENDDWANELTLDEAEIYEIRKVNHNEYFKDARSKPDNLKERITFARVKSNLGDVMYRFKGVYKLDIEASEKTGKVTYKRTSSNVKTYAPVKSI